MSNQNRPLIVGLVSPGLFWLAASVALGQVTPKAPGRPSTPAPASPATYSVLLMSNGTVMTGEIIDDPAGGVYRLKTRGGELPYPKTSVKRAGQSIDELYRYQVAALPPGDPEERMKLVRWCLAQHLTVQAREQLGDVLNLCPNDFEANRMASNLDANIQNGDRDSALERTGAEMVEGRQPPAPLDPGIVRKVPAGFGNNLPEIFDLPPAAAVRRASEFAQYIQPVLQQNCASCHNEKYQGNFQLVATRNSKDRRNPDIARANLDAALALINPDDPARSDLLSAGLVPHGPNKGAIFRGANDPQYQMVAKWVRSLRPATTNNPNSRPGNRFGGAANDGLTQTGYDAGGFATDRPGKASSTTSSGIETTGNRLPAFQPPGARNTVNEFSDAADFSGGKAADFPVPFATDGAEQSRAMISRQAAKQGLPPLVQGRLPALPGAKPVPGTPTNPVDPEAPVVSPTTAVQVAPGAVAVDLDANPNELPGDEPTQISHPPAQGDPRRQG